ncbi:hypothetical protein Acsp03_15320 [Actinomadura sp. NBRC 104412]|uniref:anti-sigma factor family protein n=1 Tax=Actinomadura sp. NBRC 104412 TaxID=3032203 RepID=UPI0024A10AA9|nr:DUF5666 domain-containing protein [Actinomadura sp. NBRC 104412]GLZ04066.1 hypothetical protein Acsp03_15320 [Actinomadura sp. NBRC 104412]
MTNASAHLSLEELVAASRPDVTELTNPHLQQCPDCRTEVERWRATAQAVRQAVPITAPPPHILWGVLDEIDRPRRGATARRGRRGVPLLAAAASAGLIAAAGYGLWQQGPADDPARTPGTFDAQQVAAMGLLPTECQSLKVAAGTLRSKDGSALVVETSQGKQIKVDASAASTMTRQVVGGLADLSDGTRVMVRGDGDESGETITAESVLVTPAQMKLPEPPKGMGPGIASMMASRGTAMGTVSDVGSDGFTVTGPGGTRIRVATSGSTKVVKQEQARLEQLETGKYTVVVGTLNSDRSLKATTVQQDSLTKGARSALPKGFKLPEGFGAGGPKDLPSLPDMPGNLGGKMPKDLFSGLGCDSEAIAGSALNGTPL